jgi:hypothetical protein
VSGEVRRSAWGPGAGRITSPGRVGWRQEVQPVVSHDRGRSRDGVQRPLQAGPDAPLLGPGAAEDSAGAVSLLGQPQQVHTFGIVELQGAGERIEHAGGHAGQRAAFELGVVLHAHPGQRSDLTAS